MRLLISKSNYDTHTAADGLKNKSEAIPSAKIPSSLSLTDSKWHRDYLTDRDQHDKKPTTHWFSTTIALTNPFPKIVQHSEEGALWSKGVWYYTRAVPEEDDEDESKREKRGGRQPLSHLIIDPGRHRSSNHPQKRFYPCKCGSGRAGGLV